MSIFYRYISGELIVSWTYFIFWQSFGVCFPRRVNVGCGPAEERVLLTGLHAVADIYCECCKTTLGWKYVSKFFNFILLSLIFEFIARFSVDLLLVLLRGFFAGSEQNNLEMQIYRHVEKYDTRCAFEMSGLIFPYFFFAFIGTCLWEQPKVQRREIHHWDGTHDKRQWLGIAKNGPFHSELKYFICPVSLHWILYRDYVLFIMLKELLYLNQTTQTFWYTNETI